MDTAASIEAILSYGRKTSTYKVAVLRALVDIAIEAPGREPQNGLHSIPVVELARRVLVYYWRPSLLGIPQLVAQGKKRGEARAAATGGASTQATGGAREITGVADFPPGSIPGIVRRLAASQVVLPGILLEDERAGGPLLGWIADADALPEVVVEALLDVRQKLIEQPLPALPHLRGRIVDLFSILTVPAGHQAALSPFAGHEEHLKAAPRKPEMRSRTWTDLLDRERTFVVLSARAYEEISEYRFWLRDAIVTRWARECERFGEHQVAVPLSAFDLDLPERDEARVSALKALYAEVGLGRCLYTDTPLAAGWELDHFLPFSRFPVNLFWNLVPASQAANRGQGGKLDLIPQLTEGLESRYRQFLRRVIDTEADLVLRDLDTTYRRYYQTVPPRGLTTGDRVKEILSVVTSSWARLERAGVGVWEVGAA